MRALPHRDVTAAVAAVRASDTAEAVKLACEFLVLTAARWGEVRGARWDEMDTTEHVWTVPAARMKANREHRVPLCRRAVEILDASRTFGDDGGRLVFTVSDGGRSKRRCCAGCWSGSGSRPFLMDSGRRSGTERRRRRSTVARSSRRRWLTSYATRSRRRTLGRTCSSVVGGSWKSGPLISTASRDHSARRGDRTSPLFRGGAFVLLIVSRSRPDRLRQPVPDSLMSRNSRSGACPFLGGWLWSTTRTRKPPPKRPDLGGASWATNSRCRQVAADQHPHTEPEYDQSQDTDQSSL